MTDQRAGGAVAPPGFLRRNGVYLAAFLMDGVQAFSAIGSSYLAKETYRADKADLGLLTLVAAASYVVASLVFGRLSDRWGRRRLIVMGAVLDAAALAVLAGAGSFWQICVLMGIFSVGQGAFWPALEADISDHSSPTELPRRLGRFNVAWCLGFVVGWPAGGMLGQSLGARPVAAAEGAPGAAGAALLDHSGGQRIVLLLGAALALVALAVYLMRVFAPEDVPAEAPDPAALERAGSRAVPFWTIALVLNFAAMGLSGMLRSQLPEVTGGDRSALGGLFGACFFGAQVGVFALMALWRGWHFRAAPLVVGSLMAIAGGVLCGLCPAPALFAAGCLLGGLGCGVAYYSSIYYSVAAASARGHRGGIHEAVLGAGGAVVPFAGGLLGNSLWAARSFPDWTAGVPFLLAAAVLAAGLGAAGLAYVRMRRGQPAAPAARP
ncbi:MAG TPA: MFS transporter [Planctomycetota bacterium]|nr:MFS transporter [Planctomycetota bacterium]